MAAPDDQTVNDVTSEAEPMADKEESGANEKALNPNGVEPANTSATNQAALVGPSTTLTLSTSNRLRFLSIP